MIVDGISKEPIAWYIQTKQNAKQNRMANGRCAVNAECKNSQWKKAIQQVPFISCCCHDYNDNGMNNNSVVTELNIGHFNSLGATKSISDVVRQNIGKIAYRLTFSRLALPLLTDRRLCNTTAPENCRVWPSPHFNVI